MADTISLPDDVSANAPITWKPVRELADAISKLYSDKKIFELSETDNGPLTTKKSTRITDTLANTCVDDSTQNGCVYLTKDVTAPFRLDKLGEEGNLAPKCLAFEFAYDINSYKDYLKGTKLPVLTTQYLIYHELPTNEQFSPNEGHVSITTRDIVKELSSQASGRNETTICNLIESRRDKIKKFWKQKSNGEAETYADAATIAGELYLKIKTPGGGNCTSITRVAFAGLNNNGNGNSGNNRPAPFVEGNVGDITYFLGAGETGWNGDKLPVAITLTGVTMDREYGPGQPVSEKGFKPEGASNAKDYTPPPIGCCGLCSWPTIGAEGGGGRANTFFNPGVLDNYIKWADWRAQYQKELTVEEAKESAVSSIDEIPAGRFPCSMGTVGEDGKPANAGASYAHATKIKNTTYFQSWINVSDNTYVRVAPLEFNGSGGKKAYLAVPLTIAVILEPVSYQTAIRKRWYDMIYYSLRNIAGYKHYNQSTGDTKIIGVTWNTTNDSTNTTVKSIDVEKYLNPCASNGNSDDKCNCNTCKFERWKYLNLGGEGWENDDDTNPFVGTPEAFEEYNKPDSKNCAQMWLWDQDRYNEIDTKVKAADADYLFPELYFEKLICYNNNSIFGAKAGGFKMKEETAADKVCGCTLCDEQEYKLPWEGGGDNDTCEEDNYLTHAETFNKLNYLAKFILDYKLPETTTRELDKLEIGNCFSYATAGKGNIKFTNAEPKITVTDSSGAYRCITKNGITYTLPIVAPCYQTLSSNETFEIQKEGASSSIETEEEAYGYNAYVWKAFDPGGLRENQDKDLKITFTHYRPARVCSSPTLIDIDESYIKKVDSSCIDYPLYLEDSGCQYTDSEWDFESDDRTAHPICYPCRPSLIGALSYYPCNNCEYKPNKKHACDAAERNKELWDEVMWWALQDPEDSVVAIKKDVKPPDKDGNNGEWFWWLPASCAGAIPMWSRDNSETSIGTIDIYLAPVPKSKGGDKHSSMAKYLGSCQFKIECNDSNDKLEYISACAPNVITFCDNESKAVDGTNTVLDTSDQQITYEDTYGVASSSSVIKTKITHAPTTTAETDNYLEAEITIPSDLLIDKSSEGTNVYDDQRQQYIILAHRASHTHINSWLTDSKEVNLTDEDEDKKKLKTWATMYASACRYAAFNTNFTFERTDT